MSADEDKNIFVSDQEILSLIIAWKSQVGRDPTDDEIARIINNLIDEEILYREALVLGLEQEDKIIKRRLAQKITFLKEESIPGIPTNDELINFFENNKEKYFIQPSFTFTHYFFSDNNDSLNRAKQALANLALNQEIISDPFYLGKSFANEPFRNIESNFGAAFATNFIDQTPQEWVGPIKSIFGHHVIYINNINSGFTPDIQDVFKQVEVDYLQQKRDEAVSKFLKSTRSKYTIFINPELKF
jgi:hypothetical protein